MQREQSIIRALAYFNLFNYPLKQDELHSFLDIECGKDDFSKALKLLMEGGKVHVNEGFYSLQKNKQLAERRKKGNELASIQLKRAGKIGRFLYCFPFVTGVAISGSLSKNYADPDSDIDFFIITKANRLWLARTVMHIFKKLSFITGRQHWFCMNYYIDEQALEIREKNIFTAMEIMTILPVSGEASFRDFFASNKWASQFFPRYVPRNCAAIADSKPVIKYVFEKVFEKRAGEWFNKMLMNITLRRWQKKAAAGRRSHSGELMALDAGLHYAKPDPANFQRRILYKYEKEVERFLLVPDKFNVVPAISFAS